MPAKLHRLVQRARAAARALTSPTTLGVRAIATDRSGRVLLVRHTYVNGWHLPGGAVDGGEACVDALLRELREEVGLVSSSPPELFGLYLRPAGSWSDHIALYALSNIALEFRPNVEVAEIHFAGPSSLPEGTSGATLRRLAEFAGGVQREPVW